MSGEAEQCESCAIRSTKPYKGGAYHLACLACCTDLVLSTHPSRQQAAAMLAAIQRFTGNPGREQIVESVRRALEKLP